MLCWRLFDIVQPPLDLEKIFKYALVHDFSERGHIKDINTYASKGQKEVKKEREEQELQKLSAEFEDFTDFVNTINSYEEMSAEAVFVWTIDKIQAFVLGFIDDNWHPYRKGGVTREQITNKWQQIFDQGSPYLKEVCEIVYKDVLKTYYDQ